MGPVGAATVTMVLAIVGAVAAVWAVSRLCVGSCASGKDRMAELRSCGVCLRIQYPMAGVGRPDSAEADGCRSPHCAGLPGTW